MDVRFATLPASDEKPNEDFVVASPSAVVLLDGAGIPAGVESGCTHGVAWYAEHLGIALLAAATERRATTLADALAESIASVADSHRDTCDLSLGAPSATVVALRQRGAEVDYLVLADSTLVLEVTEGVQVITDDREAAVGREHRGAMDNTGNGTPEHEAALADYIRTMRRHRNVPGGFWVAATEPDAATHALTGSIPAEDLRSALLLSDGATRLMDRFDQITFAEALRMVKDDGPVALIEATRQAERSDAQGSRWPRGKTYDDATTAIVSIASR